MIKIKSAKKTYSLGEEKIHALNGITFNINGGEFISIIGPSGSGKSTLLHVIGGLDCLDKGTVSVSEQMLCELKDKNLAEYRNQVIGFVFQKFNLQHMYTALENVELPLIIRGLGKKARRRKAKAALKKVGLGDRLSHKPSELSGGQQQRVSIARALVNDPKIILADEPTGNLDSKSGRNIIKLLKKINNELNVTVIVVTHDDRIAKVSDRILRILDGKVAEDVVNGKNEIVRKHTD